MACGTRLVACGSQFTVYGLRFTDHGIRLKARQLKAPVFPKPKLLTSEPSTLFELNPRQSHRDYWAKASPDDLGLQNDSDVE